MLSSVRSPENPVQTTTLQALNVAPHLDLSYGGIAASLPGFSRWLAAAGNWKVCTVGFCRPDEDPAITEADGEVVRMPKSRLRWMTDSSLKDALAARVSAADVVHIHGIWDEHCEITGRLARQFKKPYMVSAHGMLESWALRDKRLKKMIYSALVERRNLNGAHCLRAITPAEIDDYREYGAGKAFAVLPHGVDVPEHVDAEVFWNRYPHLRGKRIVLFLSRIHYKKGLDLLCRAWAKISKRFDDVHLVLAGKNFGDTPIDDLVAELGIANSITFTGMVTGDLKWGTIAAADVFVLPSYSEAFGIAISEAMVLGKPVIVTRQCKRPEIAEEDCGWIIEPDAGQVESALAECLAMPSAELNRIGGNGRRLIESRYTWPVIGQQTAAVYEWMLGGPRPSCVEIIS